MKILEFFGNKYYEFKLARPAIIKLFMQIAAYGVGALIILVINSKEKMEKIHKKIKKRRRRGE